jgi:tetratricopeptide (TPR) repeat protein
MKDLRLFLALLAGLWASAGQLIADVIVTRAGSHTGTITKVLKDSITINTGAAEVSVSRRDIVRFEVLEPKEIKDGRAAARVGNAQEAVRNLQPTVERLAGLPVAWVADAMMLLTDASIRTKDYGLAKKTLAQLQEEYPNWLSSGAAEVRLARIQCEQKQYGTAMGAVKGVITELLKKDYLNATEEQTIAEAYLVLGDSQIGGNEKEAALDSYLRVVTLFDFDAVRAGQAHFKAARLYDDADNWKRAQTGYREALERAPSASWAEEAKTRLAAIGKAHPE